MDKQKYIKITTPGGGHYISDIQSAKGSISEYFYDLEPGDKVTAEAVYLTNEEYDLLPEFDGD